MEKVLQVNAGDIFWGGVEILVFNQFKCIDRNKLIFDFFTPGKVLNKDFEDSVLRMGGKIYQCGLQKKEVFFFWKFCSQLNRVLKNGEYNIVQITTGSTIVLMLGSFISQRNGVRKRIVYSQNAGTPNPSAIKKIITPFLKVLVMIYATDFWYPSSLAFKWNYYKVGKKKYCFMPNAVPMDKFFFDEKIRKTVRHQLNIGNDDFVIGHIGRFESQKNHDFIVRIYKELKRESNNYKLLLIGDGTLKQQIINQLEGDDGGIIIDSSPDVYKYYNAMDSFLFPSIYEGLGIVAIEAQCNGLPVIASNGVPIEAKVLDNFFRVSLSENVDTWAEYIKNNKRINPSEARERMRKSIYNMEIAVSKLEDEYLA